MDEKQLITTRKTINDLINNVLCNLQLQNHIQHTKKNTWPRPVLWMPLLLTKPRVFQMQKNNAFEDILLLGLTGDAPIDL